MRHIRVFLLTAGLAALCACGDLHYFSAGVDSNNSVPAGSHGITASATAKEAPPASIRMVASSTVVSPSEKLIALTFDDGPRPYVLFGTKGDHPAPGLVDILDQNGIKATFFVVGWRLTPKTWGEPRHEENIGVTCIDAAEQLIRRGHELEDHTYSHLELRTAEKKNGEPWVIHDVDRGAQAIKAVTGTQPRFVRPPDWIITSDARRDIEQQGYRLLTISSENPMALRDVNSLDYLCAGRNPIGCPKPSLVEGVLKQLDQREKKGTYTHILAFHELSTTTAAMPRLISDLKARGYRFVTLTEYMKLVGPKSDEPVKQAAAATPSSIVPLSR
jgi:peptidoglycan/xylan/chitin deacetylase (PgdA/CDA1 family)